jgi:hypothetical protein
MEIGPASDKPSAQPSKKDEAPPQKNQPGQAPRDRVELSLETNRRIQGAVDEARSEKSSHRSKNQREDKLALVKSRIETGYYERPEVMAEIADRLIDELG